MIFPTTLALISNMFTEPAQRAKAIGVWAAMTGIGVAAGPLTGGWLLEHFSWGSTFWVNVPVAAAAVVGGALFVPTSRNPSAPPIDVPGLVLSSVGISALVYSIIEAPAVGWTAGRTIAGFVVAAIVLAGFGVWEIRTRHPMLDLTVLRNRRFSGGSLAVTAGLSVRAHGGGPAQSGGEHGQPASHHHGGPDPLGQSGARHGGHGDGDCDGQQSHPGLEGAVGLDELEVLGDHEDETEQRSEAKLRSLKIGRLFTVYKLSPKGNFINW